MEAAPALIEQLNEAVSRLPLPKAVEVLDFAQYLVSKESGFSKAVDETSRLDPANDPLLKLIGLVAIGNLSDKIDEVVYDQ